MPKPKTKTKPKALRLYVWVPPSLCDHTDGVLAVLATSKAEAIKLGAQAMCHGGLRALRRTFHQSDELKRALAELISLEPKVYTKPHAVACWGGG